METKISLRVHKNQQLEPIMNQMSSGQTFTCHFSKIYTDSIIAVKGKAVPVL
jgi:hypothetical protein